QGLWLATLIGIPLTLLIWNLPIVLGWLGQKPVVVALATPYLQHAAFFLLPLLWFSVLRSFVSALSRANIIMFISVAAIGLNFVLTRGLVHGEFGLPALGLRGAGIAFSIVNWMMFLILALFVVCTREFKPFRIFQGLLQSRPNPALWREIASLGLPVAGLVSLEAGLFIAVSVLSGVFGVDALASYQILMSWVGIPFVIAFGIANATMVRVAYGLGQDRPELSRLSGILGIGSGVVLISALAFVPIVIPETIVNLFLRRDDPGYADVFALVSQLLLLVACFQVFDGLQSISSHALRGLRDTVAPLWIAALGYWVIGIGGGSVLAFKTELGVSGLWWGLAFGLIVTGTLLCRRFLKLSHFRLKTRLQSQNHAQNNGK
ncbi:MAG: MATE family efflux transporter, partial [Gammaproteobacteria bacterium]|nr:MATE family efflux transporter [Gammaproteobacteria bacterium]